MPHVGHAEAAPNGRPAYGPEVALAIPIPLGAVGLAYFGPITLVIFAPSATPMRGKEEAG